jgi:hypothetical protein
VPQVFAGFICGYALALLSTPLLAVALLRLRADSPLLARLFPQATSVTALAMILHFSLFFACTGLGMILGLVLLAMDGSGGALGSPNAPFTLFAFGTVVAIVAPLFVLVPPMRALSAANAVIATAGFGWLMPYLAEWAPR